MKIKPNELCSAKRQMSINEKMIDEFKSIEIPQYNIPVLL
jgi:hypothetical protein